MRTINEAVEQKREPGLHVLRLEDRLVVDLGSTHISVETPKKPGRLWSEKGREDIETARATYRVTWGDVPAWDRFDLLPLTHNYIAYITHGRQKTSFEALSNRMVLEGPEDLTFYHLDGIPLRDVLAERLFRNRGLEPRPIAGESRIGAVRPLGFHVNMHTAEAFSAIKLLMVADARKAGVEYIACQTRPNMPVTRPIDGVQYELPPTEDVLGLTRGSIRLDRTNADVVAHILKYPGYFLDTQGVFVLVQRLVAEEELSKEELERQTGLSDIRELLKPRNVKVLVPLIESDNRLGMTLRERLLNDVADGTYSSLSHVDDIEKRAMIVLQRASELELSHVGNLAS